MKEIQNLLTQIKSIEAALVEAKKYTSSIDICVAEFNYQNVKDRSLSKRKIAIQALNAEYLLGEDLDDNNQFKSFKKSHISKLEIAWKKLNDI